MANQFAILKKLLDQLEPGAARAFLQAMADWRQSVDMGAFTRAISNNNAAAAIQAMHLDPSALQPFITAIESTYLKAGAATVAPFPKVTSPQTGAKFVVRFNGRDAAVETWLRDNSSWLVTDISNKQRNAIRLALAEGLARGDNPTTTALDIVGRVGQNGKRQGGVIGLTQQQTQFLLNAKQELKSTDPALLRNYLTRELRDNRFDGSVDRAIASGTTIDADTRTRMLVSYSNRLLKFRGDTVARTETLSALHAGQHASIDQMVATGAIKKQAVKKRWRSAHDSRVRHTHNALDRKPAIPFDQPYKSPSGARLMYPGDTSLGAPAEEIIKCRCLSAVDVDFLHGVT